MRLRFPPRTKRRIRKAPLREKLLIRLIEDVGILPAGFTYQLEKSEAVRLIARRKATAVGAYKRQKADLVLTADEYREASCPAT